MLSEYVSVITSYLGLGIESAFLGVCAVVGVLLLLKRR